MYLVYYSGKLIPQVFTSEAEALSEISVMTKLRNTELSPQDIANENYVLYGKKRIIDTIFNTLAVSYVDESQFTLEKIETKSITTQRIIEIHEYLRNFFTKQ